MGSSCEETEECPFGSDCYQGVCTAAVGLGEDCTVGPCQQDADCRDGVCEKRLGPGEACDDMLDRSCDFSRGLMCNPYTKRCEELLIAGHGEPCGWVVGDGGVERYALCREGGVCVDEYPSGTGLCRLPAADGAPCDGSLDFPCRSPAICLGAACTIPDVLACE